MKLFSYCLLALSLLSAPLFAESEFPGSYAILVGSDAARAELKVTKSQATSLDEIRSSYRSRARQIVANLPQDREQRRASADKLATLTHTSNAQVEEVLSPSQLKRLREVNLQILAGHALVSPSVQQALGLTLEQKAKIQAIHAQTHATAQGITSRFESAELGHRERLELLRVARDADSAKLLGVLTRPQRKAFETLMGEPIKRS